MRRVVLLLAMLGSPVLAQDEPDVTPEETAAATAAVAAANLSDAAYRNLWCAGLYARRHTTEVASAEPGAAQATAEARDTLYRKAAVELLAAGMAESEFTGIAEEVYTVVLAQTRAGATARDFTDEDCEAAGQP